MDWHVGRKGSARGRPHYSGKSISPCMMRLDSTEKPSKDGSTDFFLPLRFPLAASKPASPSSPSCAPGSAVLPCRFCVCQSRDSPSPRAAFLRSVNSLAKAETASDLPRYMDRYDSTSVSSWSEKRKCASVTSSLPVSPRICSTHHLAIADGMFSPPRSKSASPSSAPPLLDSSAPLPFFFLALPGAAPLLPAGAPVPAAP
mmetsp:Transcript_32821/g.106079  ORF Transcript_32821/g.106079 Transcript_32821/m.106079 type:complete len:201 (+) Transcript_32821:876-1478(+)